MLNNCHHGRCVFSILPFDECYSSNIPHFFEGVWTNNKNMQVLKINLWNVLFGMKQTPKTSFKIVWVEFSSFFWGDYIYIYTTQSRKKNTHTHTRWWFQTFSFSPLTWGNKIPNFICAYFSKMGLKFNHQLDTVPIWRLPDAIESGFSTPFVLGTGSQKRLVSGRWGACWGKYFTFHFVDNCRGH